MKWPLSKFKKRETEKKPFFPYVDDPFFYSKDHMGVLQLWFPSQLRMARYVVISCYSGVALLWDVDAKQFAVTAIEKEEK